MQHNKSSKKWVEGAPGGLAPGSAIRRVSDATREPAAATAVTTD